MLSFNRLRGGEVGCLTFAGCKLTHTRTFCQLTFFVQLGAKVTLITSLSEFISVFKQPTSSVVFDVLYEYDDDSYS